MNELTGYVIRAHGGLERWNAHTHVRAHLRNGGALWAWKGQEGVLDEIDVRVELHRQFASHFPFGDPELRTAFTQDHVAILNGAGPVAQRDDPRAAFAGHAETTPWDRLHLAYFCGYAMWTYLTAPFSFALPGVRCEDLGDWAERGETWRRLRVTFPDEIATHCSQQTFYYGEDGLLRRHDYTAEVVGGGPAAHYASAYGEFDGIMVPTKRRAYPIGEDGTVLHQPLLVSIDLSAIHFE